MKRLGIYSFTFVLLVSLTGGFIAPVKVIAAFESASAYLINSFSSKEAAFQTKYTPAQKTEYQYDYNSLKGIISTHTQNETPSIGDAAFEIRVLDDFKTFLKGRLAVQTDPSIQQVINDASGLADALQTQISAGQFDQSYYNAASGGAGVVVNADQTNADAATQVKNTKENGSIIETSKCNLLNGNLLGCIDQLVTFLIKGTLLQIAGFLVWLAANMLNYAIQISVLDFSSWSPASLYPIWIVIRQIVSLIVVFSGLYLGFMYIIGREDTFGKYVGWLVLFALFVNFSYPITRALVDVSNIISLNVYSGAVGKDALESDFTKDVSTAGGNTAGALISSRLGLYGLLSSASGAAGSTAPDSISKISSTPGALVAVVFVIYAAYVLFMATALLVVRSAVFSFLIVASPLLLVDAVVPKLGEAAVKMRKMFFEQLVVAPVFMLMLALTLKFMEVFQTDGGPLTSAGTDNIKVFFNFLMMIIMLHIALKVTKSVAGSAGLAATNFMGKVGGFGLGVASGGTGLLARGTVGLAAARMRDSGMMDKLQGSRTGRGLYSLTNSLAQSTYDTRNIGLVGKGMATAGMGMGQGLKQNYDQRFTTKEETMKKKYSSIRDSAARQQYIAQKTGGIGAAAQRLGLKPLGILGVEKKDLRSDNQLIADKIQKGKETLKAKYDALTDPGKKKSFYLENKDELDKILNETNQAPSIIASTQAETLAEAARTSSTLSELPTGPIIDTVHPGGSDFSAYNKDTPLPQGGVKDTVHTGGSDMSAYGKENHPVPPMIKTVPIESARLMSAEEIVATNKKLEEARSQVAQTEPPLAQSQATLNKLDIQKQSFNEIMRTIRQAKTSTPRKDDDSEISPMPTPAPRPVAPNPKGGTTV